MKITKIGFKEDAIFIQTNTGEIASHPLEWFPRLLNATPAQRANYKLSPMGIHWEELDEDLSFEGFFNYKNESKGSNEVVQH